MSKRDFDKDATLDFDDVLYASGYFGRYNFIQVLLQMAIGFSVAFPVLSIVFIGFPVPHTCRTLRNTTISNLVDVPIDNMTTVEYGQCSIRVENNISGEIKQDYLPCLDGHNYSMPRETSYVSEWDLVCDQSGLGELSQTLMMLGQGFGGLLFSSLSDKYGRKPLYIFTLFGLAALGFGMAFSPNNLVYIIIRFLIGGFQQGAGLTAYTLFVESLTTPHRPLAGTIGGLVWSGSVMTMAPIAYAMQNYSWRYLQMVLSCASLYFFLLPWTLDESLRWLLANNNTDLAKRITKKAAKTNHCDVSRAVRVLDTVVQAEETSQEVTEIVSAKELKSPVHDEDSAFLVNGEDKTAEKRPEANTQYTILDLFRHSTILKTSAITWYIWTVNSLTYYGLFLTSTSLAGNRFLNFFLSCLVEIPGTLSVFFLLKKLGRRHVCMLYHFMAAVALIISVIILTTAGDTPAGTAAATAFNLIGKFSITGSFNALFIYSPELFPTNLRNAGLGMGSAMSRVGGMSAPYSRQLAQVVSWGPGALFASLCFLATFLIRYLPETSGRELPTTIEEIKEMYERKKKKRPSE